MQEVGKGKRLKGKGKIPNLSPFPLPLFPTYARSLMKYTINTTRFVHFELRIWFGEKVKGVRLKVFSFPFPPPLIPRGDSTFPFSPKPDKY
ncbi:hypothetical protein FACHB389_05095 [Nostoc calcicola FACHB-389]|nr:hypothetical protein FACHB389_05095 [Nostoc calcicola FACHB-389]